MKNISSPEPSMDFTNYDACVNLNYMGKELTAYVNLNDDRLEATPAYPRGQYVRWIDGVQVENSDTGERIAPTAELRRLVARALNEESLETVQRFPTMLDEDDLRLVMDDVTDAESN